MAAVPQDKQDTVAGESAHQPPGTRITFAGANWRHHKRPAAAQSLRTLSGSLIVIPLILVLGAPLGPRVTWWPRDFAAREQPAEGPIATPWLGADAVSVQRLNVPDLVVIDQLNQAQVSQHQARSTAFQADLHRQPISNPHSMHQTSAATFTNQPEAASLINSQQQQGDNQTAGRDQQLMHHQQRQQQQQQQLQQFTFECLVSFDKRKDKNLIVKWHHDERNEPIYQWIPELNKRTIAPQYRPFIVPTVATIQSQSAPANGPSGSVGSPSLDSPASTASNASQNQILEAGFRLVRPSKELGGKYTCSAISSQNDDSKSKKMIVYTPPRSFRFNASRTDLGSLMTSQRDRLIQLTQPATLLSHNSIMPPTSSGASSNQLPMAYRMRGLNIPFPISPTTMSPQMYSTIDYVNVNQQRASLLQHQQSAGWPQLGGQQQQIVSALPQFSALDMSAGGSHQVQGQPVGASNSAPNRHQMNSRAQYGVKLVCDIDQVFPVPEVSIYRLAKSTPHSDTMHPEKLPKLESKIERDLASGLFHVQVTTVLDDDELQMKYGPNEPVHFECLIALTNLELSKYADNKRSIIYRPGSVANSLQSGEDIKLEQYGNSANSLRLSILASLIPLAVALLSCTSELRGRSHISPPPPSSS